MSFRISFMSSLLYDALSNCIAVLVIHRNEAVTAWPSGVLSPRYISGGTFRAMCSSELSVVAGGLTRCQVRQTFRFGEFLLLCEEMLNKAVYFQVGFAVPKL